MTALGLRSPLLMTVPGLNGSGTDHWQTRWERTRSDCVRAELGCWSSPLRNSWVTKLDIAIRTAPAPIVLVAHSLGCIAVAWWASLVGQPQGWPVVGALLVAPPYVERHGADARIAGFGPVPRAALPFPSIVVASRDDPYATMDQMRDMAGGWLSSFVDVGACGHINAASGLGDWHEGQAIVGRLVETVEDAAPPPESATIADFCAVPYPARPASQARSGSRV
jgi:hypothetical protein